MPLLPAFRVACAAFVFALLPSLASAQTVKAYGPGGPLPAMREAADAFREETGVTVELTAGPTAAWLARAKPDADLIFSGSETMMTDIIWAMEGATVEESVMPLYLRPAAILVRPGNPPRIGGVRDLLRPGRRVLVVNGAGQNGLWCPSSDASGQARAELTEGLDHLGCEARRPGCGAASGVAGWSAV